MTRNRAAAPECGPDTAIDAGLAVGLARVRRRHRRTLLWLAMAYLTAAATLVAVARTIPADRHVHPDFSSGSDR